MQAVQTSIRPVFKYAYLITFFALLAGFFHPIITMTGFGDNVLAILMLFVGTTGGVLLIKSAESKNTEVLMIAGFVLIGVATFFIFLLSGRL